MKPEDLLGIEVVATTDLTAGAEKPFIKVWRYLVRNNYKGGRASRDYPFDLAVTRFCDGIAVVFYHRDPNGTLFVGLRRGTRPALLLRQKHAKYSTELPETGISLELVAGGVETDDYQGIGIGGRAAEELWEEAGFRVSANQLVRLGASAFTATGFAIEKMHYFCVEVDPTKRKNEGSTEDNPHEEVGAIEFVELSEALARCREGRISDQKTEVGLFRFASKVGYIPPFGLKGGTTT